MPDLYDHLKKLDNQTRYPFHMPGHKRNPLAGPFASVMAMDITEIDGFDDLHDATGIIREAENRAARLTGAEETHFLVNGSTAGILTAVSTVCAGAGNPQAGPVWLLAGRASHMSLYHAAYLNRIMLQYLTEETLTEGAAGITGVVTPGEVLRELDHAAGEGVLPAAVFVTCPNYYGVTGDVASIVEIAHAHQVPVIVDEAHGAHFGFGFGMPDSAVHAGADIVVQSVHKTLPSLTQTALLHVQGNRIDRERLRRFLRIYQTSSPSYILMGSIDSCMTMAAEWPRELFGTAVAYKKAILGQSAHWKKLRVLSERIVRDPCKVVISTAETPMTGHELYELLLENYGIQPEMAGQDEVLLILTGMDTEDGVEALLWALSSVDQVLAEGALGQGSGGKRSLPTAQLPETVFGIADAWDAPGETVSLPEAAGRICAEPVVPYPPGTPLLVPGERIDVEMVARLQMMLASGFRIRGISGTAGDGKLRVVK